MFKELFSYRTMISSLIKRDLRGRYKASILGFLWTFLNPLFQIIIYSIVFSFILKSGVDKYYLHLCVVLIPWIFFSSSLTGGSLVIVGNSTLVKKIFFPREVLPISYVTSSFCNMLFSFVVVFIIIFFSGTKLNFGAVLYLPFIMVIEYILTLGVTFISCSINVYFRDMQQILGLVNMAWMYMTPVIYSADAIPKEYEKIFFLNPMTPIAIAYRNILYYGIAPQKNLLIYAFIISVIILIIGEITFSRLKIRFAEEL